MKSIVNPFEPWRPQDVPIPPPIHAARPWRPASPPPARPANQAIPFAEPVDPPRQNRARKCCGKRKEAARVEKRNAAAKSSGTACRVLGVLAALLVLGSLTTLGSCWLGGSHFFRVVFTLLAVTVSFTFGLAPASPRTWASRLTWMATGLALAGLSAWFVPTLRGVNLWSAYRQVEELRTLPAGEIAEYQRGAVDRRILIAEFPSFTSDIRAAETAWLRRTVDEVIENAERQADRDPQAALATLQRWNEDLKNSDQFSSVREDLQTAQQRFTQIQDRRKQNR